MCLLFDDQDEYANIRPFNMLYNSDKESNFNSNVDDNVRMNVFSSIEYQQRFLKHRLFDISQLRNIKLQVRNHLQ